MIRKAKSLNPPCNIGVIAPASAPRADHHLKEGLQALKDAGFNTVTRRDSFESLGYLAGGDQERLEELNGFLRDDSVDALICVRGGYGTLRILGQVDYEAAAAHPKLLVGYSDITALQLALYKHAGWVSMSGPMVAVEWPRPDGPSCQSFLQMASSSYEPGSVDPTGPPPRTLVPGEATGTLLGGNLTLLTRLIGTEHMPDLSGAILFLEEVGETPYRVDGLFAHLQLAGILDVLAGVVLGGFTESETESGKPTLTMQEVFEDYLGDLGIPIVSGLRYGHFQEKVSIPIGVQAELTADESTGKLTILESITI